LTRNVLDDAIAIVQSVNSTVSFSGAGLSAESGLSTFRDKHTGGIWAKHDPMRLASPEGFSEDPKLVLDWYSSRRRNLAAAKPNPAHTSLAAHKSMTHITQNVDDLLERAGARNTIHLHGTLIADRCHARCGYRENIDLAKPPKPRPCPNCNAPLRPDVVWFGESLPSDAWARAEQSCLTTELLLVIGTSACVYPAAGLIEVARSAGAQIICINTEKIDGLAKNDIGLIGTAGDLVPKLLSSTDCSDVQ